MKKLKLTKWDSIPLIQKLPEQLPSTIWAFATQKGGVGKTTLAWQFAEAIVKASKQSTLLVNLDFQTNVIDTALMGDGDGALVDTSMYITTMDLFDLSVDEEGHVVPSPLVEEKELYMSSRGIFLIPSNQAFSSVDRLEDDPAQIAAPLINIQYLAKRYDISNTILDCMPHLGFGVKASLFVADYVIPPAMPHDYSVSGFAALCYQLRQANLMKRDLNLPPVKLVGFLINLLDKSSAKANKALKDLRKQLGDAILDTEIKLRNPIADATAVGLPVWENRRGGSPEAACEMLNAISEILNRASDMHVNKSDPHDETATMLADYHESNQS
jgi:chromosome partitioning protein